MVIQALHRVTNFGAADITTGEVVRIFFIENIGTAPLTLGSTAALLTGDDAGEFTIIQQPASTVAPDAMTELIVRFDPTTAGSKQATLSIANNDADEAPYNFAISGMGTGTAAYRMHTSLLKTTGWVGS